MKYLVAGLGNIGEEYAHTRHNIGFDVLDALAKASDAAFDVNKRYGAVAELRLKNHTLILLKPSTYMNNSGKAIRYWLQKENIPTEQLLVIVDDISLPIGAVRLRGNGSSAGHNGLKSIEEMIENQQYPRLKFGIGNDFLQGAQIHFVLGKFSEEERKIVDEKIDLAVEAIKSFCLEGLSRAMNKFNNK
ncbi:MAG: aminoacyl-tRNA hydrolase [Prevotellaceae bacterium]|jgi:PTH1 family peptidyl-tRNA hydrolase|nr:aminoacyl-tRNA hydrolase [Prevotellaceae bacterium]